MKIVISHSIIDEKRDEIIAATNAFRNELINKGLAVKNEPAPPQSMAFDTAEMNEVIQLTQAAAPVIHDIAQMAQHYFKYETSKAILGVVLVLAKRNIKAKDFSKLIKKITDLGSEDKQDD